jgi:hypothetical protein
MHASLKPLSFGEILDGAFVLYRRGFFTLAATALLAGAVAAAANLLLGGPTPAASIVLRLVGVVMYAVAWTALTWQLSKLYAGRAVSVNDGVQAAGARLFPVLGAWLIAFVLYGIPVLLAGRVVFRMGVRVSMEAAGASGGLLLMLIPALAYVAMSLTALVLAFAIVPAVVLEGADPRQAVARSFRLAGTAPVRVGALAVVVVALNAVLTLGLLRMGGWTDDPLAIASGPVQLVLAGARALLLPFIVGAAVLTYYDLRVRAEGLDVQLAGDKLAWEPGADREPDPFGGAGRAPDPREELIPLE